jgi:hypothetical protein
MAASNGVKSFLITAIMWLWTGSLIFAMFAIYVASWQWTLVAVGYLAISLTVVGFASGKIRLNGHTEHDLPPGRDFDERDA